MVPSIFKLDLFSTIMITAFLTITSACQDNSKTLQRPNKLATLEPDWQICLPNKVSFPNDRGTDILSMKDGSILVSGIISSNDRFAVTSTISSLSASGHINWLTKLESGKKIEKIIATDDQSIFAVGSSYRREKAGTHPIFYRLSKYGKIEIGKNITEQLSWHEIRDIAKDDDGHFLVTGISKKDKGSNVFLAKIDVEGRVLWAKTYDRYEHVYNLKMLQSGSGETFLVYTVFRKVIKKPKLGVKKSYTSNYVVMKVDKSGDKIKTYRSEKTPGRGNNVHAFYSQTGGLIVTFSHYNTDSLVKTQMIDTLDDELNIEKQVAIKRDNKDDVVIRDIQETNGGGFYATGYIKPKGRSKRDLWLGLFSRDGIVLSETQLETPDNKDYATTLNLNVLENKVYITGRREKSASSGACIWVLQTNL